MLPGHQVYGLDQEWKDRLAHFATGLFLLGISPIALVAVIPVLSFDDPLVIVIALPFALALTYLAIVASRCANLAQLEITPELTELRFPGFALRAHWDQVDCIRPARLVFWSAESIQFHRCEVRATRQARFAMKLLGITDAIPLVPFLPNWRQLQIGTYLKPCLPAGAYDHIEFDWAQERKRQIQERKAKTPAQELQSTARYILAGLAFVLALILLVSLGISLFAA